MDDETLQDLLYKMETRDNVVSGKDIARKSHLSIDPMASQGPLYQQMFQNNGIPRLLIDPENGAILEANAAAATFYGYAQEMFLRMHISDIGPCIPLRIAREPEQELLTYEPLQVRHRLADGDIRDVEIHADVITLQGRLLFYCTIHDITERRRAEREMRSSLRRYRQLVETASDLIYCIDGRGYMSFANSTALRLMGYAARELRGLHFTDLVRPDYHHRVHSFYLLQKERRITDTYFELPLVTHDGREIWIEQSVHLSSRKKRFLGYQAIARDISDRKRIEMPMAASLAQLHQRHRRLNDRLIHLQRHATTLEDMAVTDYLTGLHNHRAFQEQMERAIHYARQNRSPLSLLLVDLDRFKQVNDTRGHPAGDEVLRTVGTILKKHVRATDVVARYGGEEFALILPYTDQSGAVAQAERFRKLIGSSLAGDHVTASFGAATLTSDTQDRHQLIRQADGALYAAKQSGRNCVRHFALLAPDLRTRIFAVVTAHPTAEGVMEDDN